MQLLIQKYEVFHFKLGESVNDTFSRFQKLLNGLKLYGRTYSSEDTNLKFLRSLPKEWKPMAVSLRHSHEFKDYTLDNRLRKGHRKEKYIALAAQDEEKV